MQFDAHQHKLKTRGKPYKDLKLLTMKGMNAIQKYVCHSAQENGKLSWYEQYDATTFHLKMGKRKGTLKTTYDAISKLKCECGGYRKMTYQGLNYITTKCLWVNAFIKFISIDLMGAKLNNSITAHMG